jgi:hypothetical protein
LGIGFLARLADPFLPLPGHGEIGEISRHGGFVDETLD